MAGTHSAGLVLHRTVDGVVQILLVHPGGPYWANKNRHGWSIPKGEFDPAAEDPLVAARREFAEELGHPAPAEDPIPLAPLRAGRKTIHAFVVEGDLDPATMTSNHFEMEWPPRSGRMASFPEVDRAAWFDLTAARDRLHKGQIPLCDRIEAAIQP
ncbi:MAG: NUDIX domain-containing protein [Actinomycetota bacterium]